MIRKNEDRTGPKSTASDQVDPASLLDFVTPTEFVELPSQGQGYPEGHPLHGEEMIEIKFMTAKDEDILTSRSLLKKGVALERLIKNLIVNKAISSKDLLIGDRNAIVIAARSSAYGHIYETKVTCPSCSEIQKNKFDLTMPVVHRGFESEEYEYELKEDNCYHITTPYSKLDIGLRLLTGRDEMELMKIFKKNKNGEDFMVSTQMLLYIQSVNGHTDSRVVQHFINNAPAQEARYVRNAYKELAPDLKISGDFECRSCGYEQELEVPFNADFFWPDQ